MQPSIVVMLIFTIHCLSSPLIIDWTAPPAAGRGPSWSARAGCQVRATTAESQRRGETDKQSVKLPFSQQTEQNTRPTNHYKMS